MWPIFIPTDLDYIGTQAKAMAEWNMRLVPGIAHDRAGFGRGLTSWGIVLAMTAWFADRLSERLLWSTLAINGLLAFGLVTLIHVVIGYTSFVHLLAIYAIALLYFIGLLLARPKEGRQSHPQESASPAV